MPAGRRVQSHCSRGYGFDELVYDVQHRPSRTERLRQRKIENVPFRTRRKIGKMGLGLFELLGIGSLETEYGLLVITNRKQGPDRSRSGAFAGVELPRDGLHDVPLPGVGILRFVDKDMVGRLVKLVADPVSHTPRFQQLDGVLDQVVEIDHSRRALCVGISAGIGLADRKGIGEVRRDLRSTLQLQQAQQPIV